MIGACQLTTPPCLMERKTLCLATRNENKVTEMNDVLASLWLVKSSADYPELEEIEETGSTFLENATLKAQITSATIPDYVLADDSGLECDALNGAPGVFSARYGGIPSSTERNNAKLLQELARGGHLGAATRGAVPVRAGAGVRGRGGSELRWDVRGNDWPRAEGQQRLWV